MSAYSLTHGSEQALGLLLAAGGGEDTLLLRRSENTLHAMLTLQPEGDQVQAFICIGHSRWRQTLQANDPANAQHLADYLEAIANGTADTGETGTMVPTYVEIPLVPCCHCGGEAIGYDYSAPGAGTTFLHGVKCRHNDCDHSQGYATGQDAARGWAQLQAGAINHAEQALDMVNHPPHYNGHPSGVECIEVTERLPFNLGNAFKYVFRYRTKNGHEDLQKAHWYLRRELNRAERGGIGIGDLQAANALAGRIATHEAYPLGACLVAIASDEPQEALHWLDQLLAA